MIKKIVLGLSFLCSCFYVNSCTPQKQEFSTPNAGPEWIQNRVCEFPCWQYITPQVTKFDDAIFILHNAKIRISFSDEEAISFQPADKIGGGIQKDANGLVDHIVLVVYDQKIYLGDILQSIGAPNIIYISSYANYHDGNCAVYLLYPEKGAVIELNIKNQTNANCKISINKDNIIFRIVLKKNGVDAFAQGQPVTWRGYGIYP